MREIAKRIGKAMAKALPHRRPRLVAYIAVLLCLCTLLTTVTVSWIRRKWSPSIGQDNIQIMAGDALVFSLIGQNTGHDETQALSIKDFSNVILHPVSNYSGASNDFFKLDCATPNDEFFVHLLPAGALTPEAYQRQGEEAGYIELAFSIQGRDTAETAQSYTKYVFLSTDSHLRSNTDNTTDEAQKAYKAVRVSLSFDNQTVIFVPKDEIGRAVTHKAIVNDTVIKDGKTVWLADGVKYNALPGTVGAIADLSNPGRTRSTKFIYNSVSYDLIKQNPDTHTFEEFMGGFAGGGQIFDSGKTLFSITPGEQKTVILRLWLEGEDPECKASIKGALIDFLIGFQSYNDTSGGGTPGSDDE